MHQDLSPQERRVVAAVAEGKTNKQIALELGLAEPTVKNYVANAMHKADVDNRTLLALWWRQHEQAANGEGRSIEGDGIDSKRRSAFLTTVHYLAGRG